MKTNKKYIYILNICSLHPKCSYLKTKDLAFFSKKKAKKKLKKIFELNKNAFIRNNDVINDIIIEDDFNEITIDGDAHVWFNGRINQIKICDY